MNIKSLLLGSAAALVAISGARAADAIIAAEPEPVEYVRVCDAFGTGYFYIPGTETCLRISGYVRVQNGAGTTDITNGAAFNAAATAAGFVGVTALGDRSASAQTTRARVNFDARSDTEYGMLQGYIGMQGNDGAMNVDEVYLSLGGLKMGLFYHWLDSGLAGETDFLPNSTTRFNSIMYSMSGGAFTYGVSLDMYPNNWATNSAAANASAVGATALTEGLGVSGNIGATMGAITASLTGFYDTEVDEGGVRFLAYADIGPGTLGLSALYNTDANMYIGAGGFRFTGAAAMYAEWSVGADYTFAVSDKMKLGIAGQYDSVNLRGTVLATQPDVGDQWTVGTTLDYALADGLDLKGTVNYQKFDGNAVIGNVESEWIGGFLRLQRSF